MARIPAVGGGLSSQRSKQPVGDLPHTVVGTSWYLAPSGGDDAAAMQAAITAVAGSGEIVLGPGTFLWNSASPNLPAGAAGIRIRGSGKDTVIKLSSGAPRAFDFNRTGDYQTFQNVELCDLTVDCNSIGGSHHIILGNYVAGASQQRTNFDRIYVHDIKVINAPVDSTLVTARRFAFSFDLSTVASNEATQLTATNLRIERIDIAGSGVGVYIGGTAGGINSTPNAWIDNVLIAGIRHDLGVLPSSDFASATVQVGGQALVGTVLVRDCQSTNCGDVPFEFDNCQNATAQNCITTDCFGYAYLTTNFRSAANTNGGGSDWSVFAQNVNWVGCRARRKALLNAGGSTAFGRCFAIIDATGLGGSTSQQIGTVKYERCSMHRTAADASSVTLGEAFFLSGRVWRIAVDRCEATVENVANASGTHSMSMFATSFDLTSLPATLEVRGLQLNARGTIAAGAYSWYGVQLDQSNVGVDLSGSIRDVTFNVSLPTSGGGSFNTFAGVALGRVFGLRSALAISGLKFPTFGPFGSAFGVMVGFTGTFVNRGTTISDCDFSTLGVGNGVFFDSATPGTPNADQANAATTIVADTVRWPQNNSARSPAGRVATATSYTMTPLDRVIAVTNTGAARTITLPLASCVPIGDIREVADESLAAGTNNITLARSGTDTFLGGGTSKVISTNGGNLKFYSTGTSWALA